MMEIHGIVFPGEGSRSDLAQVPSVQPLQHHHVRRLEEELPHEPGQRTQDQVQS